MFIEHGSSYQGPPLRVHAAAVGAIGGALRLFGPLFVAKAGHAMLNKPYFTSIAAAVWVVLGLLFCFFGFLH